MGVGVVVVSYLVLARKFRPQTFEDIIGQEHVTRTLQNAITSDRVHHAFLFCGARGTGKTTTARVLSKALNCEKGPTPHPCNECSSCADIATGNSVDVLEIDGASHTGVDDIRELRENVRYSPTQGRRKIYIIDEVHMLSVSAFNALLKTLEEPPSHITFMFATTEPHKIPATILSRCQRFDLRRVAPATLKEHLGAILQKEGFKAEDDALELLALEAGGSVRDSLSLLDQVIAYAGSQSLNRDLVARVLGVTDRSTLTSLSHALLQRDTDAVLQGIDEVFEAGWDLVQFAKSLVEHLRDLAVLATCDKPSTFIALGAEELSTLEKQIQGVDRQRLLQFFDAASRAVDEVSRSDFPKMTLEMNLLEMALSEPLEPIGEIAARLERLENRLMKAGAAPPSRGRGEGGGGGTGSGSARSGSARSGSTRSGSARSGSTRSGSAAKRPARRGASAASLSNDEAEAHASETKKRAAAAQGSESTRADSQPAQKPGPNGEPEPPAAEISSGPGVSGGRGLSPSAMLEKWETIVSMVRNENKLLAATLASIYVDSLSWTDTHVEVGLLAERNSFAAEQLEDGGMERAGELAGKILGTPVRLSLRTAKKEEIPQRGASLEDALSRGAESGGGSPSKEAQDAMDGKEEPVNQGGQSDGRRTEKASGTPRSLRDRRELNEQRRQKKNPPGRQTTPLRT